MAAPSVSPVRISPLRRLPGAALLGALLVLLAACSGASSGPAGSSATTTGPSAGPAGTPSATSSVTLPATPSAAPTDTPPEQVLPLTGLPGAVPARPALVVKIENSAAARPQRGLLAADLVVEELVEGGITRFAAMYQSRAPGVVGPVRSLRNVDAQIAGPTRGVLAVSGGAQVALRVVRRADVRLVQPGDVGGAFFRSSARRAPHNLYLRTGLLWAKPDRAHAAPPAPYLQFGAAAGGGRSATRLALRFSAAARPTWRWDGGRRLWLRSEGTRAAVEEGGARLTATSVLVLRVRVGDAGYLDPAGNPVPETRFSGGGPALLASGGTVVAGRWSKGGPGDPVRLTGADGAPLPVPPGRTWVELLPLGARLDVA